MNSVATPASSPIGRYFMTVRRGHNSVSDLRRAALGSGKKINNLAYEVINIIDKMTLEREDIELWQVTGRELGFVRMVSRESIYARALELGFKKCLPVDGLLAIGQYKGTEIEMPLMGMDPITTSEGLSIFRLKKWEGACHLVTECGAPDAKWGSEFVWVFAWSPSRVQINL